MSETFLFVRVAITKGTSSMSPEVAAGTAQLGGTNVGAVGRAVEEALTYMHEHMSAAYLERYVEEMTTAVLTPVSNTGSRPDA